MLTDIIYDTEQTLCTVLNKLQQYPKKVINSKKGANPGDKTNYFISPESTHSLGSLTFFVPDYIFFPEALHETDEPVIIPSMNLLQFIWYSFATNLKSTSKDCNHLTAMGIRHLTQFFIK